MPNWNAREEAGLQGFLFVWGGGGVRFLAFFETVVLVYAGVFIVIVIVLVTFYSKYALLVGKNFTKI